MNSRCVSIEIALQSVSVLVTSLKSAALSNRKVKRKAVSKGTGTGYGGSSKSFINKGRADDIQTKEDIEVENVLKSIVKALEHQSEVTTNLLLTKLSESQLGWLLKYLLVNDSLLDVGSRASVYRSVLVFLKTISYEPFLAAYLTHIPNGEDCCILDRLGVLAQQSRMFLLLYQKYENEDDNDNDNSDTLASAVMMATEIDEAFISSKRGCDNADKLGITYLQTEEHDKVGKRNLPTNFNKNSSSYNSSLNKRVKYDNDANTMAIDLSSKANISNKMQQDYIKALRLLRFEAISL